MSECYAMYSLTLTNVTNPNTTYQKRLSSTECRFIEWMPFSGNNFDGKFVSMSEMKSKIALTGRSITPVETFKTDTTKWVETEGGKVGFISSMSENFCEGCNRVRITCDGNLKVRGNTIDKVVGVIRRERKNV